jgi:MoxR-like ATPase
MGPKDVTSPEAIREAMREHDALGREAFLTKYGFGKATKFVVVDGGREYDSKALLAAAHGFEHPDEGPLSAHAFSGGDQTTSRLRSLGFTITAPSVSPSPVRFGLEDCKLFERYAIPVHWNDQNVSAPDRALFKSIRDRLKDLADWLAANAPVDVQLRAFTSLYQANGRSQRDIWCCVYPAEAPNKSYALQVLLIISAAGAEVGLCLGAGQSQLTGPARADAEKAFQELQARLSSVPQAVKEDLTAALTDFTYRKSWRQPPGPGDFETLEEWLTWAAGPHGSKSSISRHITAEELERLGTQISGVLLETARAGAPLIEYCYPPDTANMPLAELVGQFRTETGYPGDDRARREAQRAELASALSPDGLGDPDLGSLRRLATNAYGFPGRQPGYYTVLQTGDGVARATRTFRYLLYGPGEVADRLDDCLSGEHKLPGVGEAIMVKALAVADPGRWLPNYVTGGRFGKLAVLNALGEEPPEDLTPGALALAANDRIRQLLDPYFPGDPWGMQEFSWWLLHRVSAPDAPLNPEASLEELADELYLSEEFLARALRLLDDKGQVVFYGPPGTGKTYVARKLADYIAGSPDNVEKVQFHPSYAYEDFIEGYRPRLENGQVTYKVVDGPLKRMAEVARQHPDRTHVLLIDEINRANVSKVLGELVFLLEYRSEDIHLQYSDAKFSLPANLRIIATMNTADRSIALIDTALRRRFHFVAFFPDTPPIDSLLRRWLNDYHPDLAWVADVVDRANRELADRNTAIGPSHFLKEELTEDLVRLAWENSVLPFLEEHFFDDPDQVKRFDLDRLRKGTPEPPASQTEIPGPSDEA